MSGILPPRAASCGLITKTDAERLCSALVHSNPEKSLNPPSAHCIRVYHNCFGKGDGHFNPELYTSPDAKCIHCVECQGLFAPTKFVCHSHKAQENRTCHWGFDSERWRDYLLAKDKKFQDALENLKSRYDPKHKHKRRQSPEREGCEQKRAKTEAALAQDVIAWGEATSANRGDTSAFTPWTPSPLAAGLKGGKLLAIQPHLIREGAPTYLHSGPPVLLNPERVIPYSESQRYERHFTPNVSLAPSAQSKTKSGDDEEEKPGEEEEQPQELTVKTKIKEEPKIVVQPSGPSSLPVAMESSREYREYDLPTDTDDSSVGQSSPLDSRDEPRFSDSPVFESTLEQELSMIHQALDGKVPNTKEGRDSFLHDYSKLRARQEELVHCLCREKRALKREVSLVQNQNEDLARNLRALENEMAGLRLDSERRERAVQEERAALAHKMAAIQSESAQEMYDKSSRQCELKARLQHFESLYHDLQYENAVLRMELQRRGVNIVELLAQKKQPIMDASTSGQSPKARSEVKPGTETSSKQPEQNGDKFDQKGGDAFEPSPDKLKLEGGDCSAQTQAVPKTPTRPRKTLPPKKERDLIVE